MELEAVWFGFVTRCRGPTFLLLVDFCGLPLFAQDASPSLSRPYRTVRALFKKPPVRAILSIPSPTLDNSTCQRDAKQDFQKAYVRSPLFQSPPKVQAEKSISSPDPQKHQYAPEPHLHHTSEPKKIANYSRGSAFSPEVFKSPSLRSTAKLASLSETLTLCSKISVTHIRACVPNNCSRAPPAESIESPSPTCDRLTSTTKTVVGRQVGLGCLASERGNARPEARAPLVICCTRALESVESEPVF